MYKFKKGVVYDGITYQAGRTYDIPKELAEKLSADGLCEKADKSERIEKAISKQHTEKR